MCLIENQTVKTLRVHLVIKCISLLLSDGTVKRSHFYFKSLQTKKKRGGVLLVKHRAEEQQRLIKNGTRHARKHISPTFLDGEMKIPNFIEHQKNHTH